ncbi:butyrophilin subfamily 3 member A1-like isoform X2 [Amphiprion ocellaris]|uniref:butyrophilin subfamily 3 member A1-like isoform X2 n=1 Tax=Amphiprion ocellaris TaxID=80972 RepID=UPI0024112EFA|nr:butyrophilin subfamily 3 member A1-like isoform X2 [Amphiprion ocellaris]
MARTQLILIFLLQFTGISGNRFLYYRLGNDVTLPCDDVPPSTTRCSLISWLYNRRTDSQTTTKVKKGKVNQNLPGAERLSLSRNCSLIINNITAEDAGRYVCRIGDVAEFDRLVHLNILTISPSPPDADPKTDDEVTLKCSLLRFGSCPLNSIRWVDEKGTVLLGEGDGFKFDGQTDCVSLLTVKHQSSHNQQKIHLPVY